MTLLTILDGKLTANYGGVAVVIDSDAKLDAFAADHPDGFFVSSSIDFPHDYTSDPAVLALVARIGRG